MSQQIPQGFSIPDPERQPPSGRRRRLKPGVKTALWTLLLLTAVAVILFAGVFRISRITVVGNSSIPGDEVVKAAGLDGGKSYFTVNEEQVKENLERNRYLVFEGMEKQFPNAMTLYVRERAVRANVKVVSAVYLMDEEGMVLEKPAGNQLREDLPIVTGLKAGYARVGQVIVPGTEEQLSAYTELMRELILQGFWGQASELKVSDPDSLYLITRNGYTIHLGNAEKLRAKIGTVRAVVAELLQMGRAGGMIEASVPGEATYTPVGL